MDGHTSSITQLTTETSTLTQAVDTLNTKTSSDSGNVIQFSDSIGFKEIVVHGKSEQASYAGKNLFDINRVSFGSNAAHSTKTATGVTITADLESGWAYGAAVVNISGVSSVTLSAVPNKNTPRIAIEGRYSDDTVAVTQSALANSVTVTLPDGVVKVRCVFYARQTASGAVGDTCTYNNIQLELGSTATSYEPYVGGKPSPNPEYPQEINSIDNLTLHVCGKNLFRAPTWAEISSLEQTISYYHWPIYLKPNTTYYVSNTEHDGYTSIGTGYYLLFSPNMQNGSWKSIAHSTVGATSGTITTDDSGIIYLAVYGYGNQAKYEAAINGVYTMLTEGSTAVNYEPYQGQSIDIPLGDHQIRSLPDGTEDTLTFSYIGPSIREGFGLYNTELIQKIGVSTVTATNAAQGSEFDTMNGYTMYGVWQVYGVNDGDKTASRNNILCDKLEVISTNDRTKTNVVMHNGSNLIVNVAGSYSSISEARAALIEIGPTFYYPLATPVTHSFGVVELPLSKDLNLWASTSPSTTIEATW